MTYKSFILALLVLFSMNVFSQDFDAYKREQQERFEKFKEGSENEIKKLHESYRLYVQKQNEEFSKYIDKNWEAFNTVKGENRPENPKPDTIPVYRNKIRESELKKIKPIGIKEIIINPSPDLLKIPISDSMQTLSEKNISFLFYGQEINLLVDQKLVSEYQGDMDQVTISKIWTDVSTAGYEKLIDQLYIYKDNLNLNDWGYFKLNNAVADILSNHDTNYKKVLTWAFMNLSGYSVRIGLFEDNCYIMVPTLQKIYSTYSLNVNDIKYYILDYRGNRITTYKQEFEGAYKYIDLNFYKPLSLAGNNLKVSFKNDNTDNWEIDVNENVIDFYNDYPLVDLPIYFNAPMTPETRNSLVAKLTPYIEGKSEKEKVAFLLNFVQNKFEYKTDRDQFGHEKFFFPDELLYYPYSDCEDRSVLFAYLVRWFTGFDIIGLEYPQHLATAVAIPGEISGDFLEYNGINYTICDPTFRNAPIGMVMTEYKGVSPSIIPVSNFFSRSEETDMVWADLIASGASKSSTQNSCFDNAGNCFLTGTFSGELNVENRSINSLDNGTNIFVSRFNNSGELSWIMNVDNGFYDNSGGIAVDNNKLYVCSNSSSINGDERQVSISSFSSIGEQLWNSNFIIDSTFIGENLVKTYHLSLEGELISEENSFSGSQVVNSGIYVNGNELIVSFDFNNSLGLRIEDITISSSSEMSTLDRLKLEYKKNIQTSCEQYTAAVMAVFNLLKFDGMLLSGAEISQVIQKNNPDISSILPDLMASLKKIDYFKNENGRINLKTKSGKRVAFFNMYFYDKASIKVTKLSGQRTKIECLAGVKVGNSVVKFQLNSITINLPKGDFMFDYGKDHSKQNVNLRKDILEI